MIINLICTFIHIQFSLNYVYYDFNLTFPFSVFIYFFHGFSIHVQYTQTETTRLDQKSGYDR